MNNPITEYDNSQGVRQCVWGEVAVNMQQQVSRVCLDGQVLKTWKRAWISGLSAFY